MTDVYNAVVVGSGPAGVSAAFPLAEAGLDVLIVDGGRVADTQVPDKQLFSARREDEEQWKWMIGRNFYAFGQTEAVSPKLRVSTHAHVFEGFSSANKIVGDEFVAVGSLAAGGLSNAWGCGAAGLSPEFLSAVPFARDEAEMSLAHVVTRVGISGQGADDLSAELGLDTWADPPLQLDSFHSQIYARYGRRRSHMPKGFRLGRARLAVLSRDVGPRQACNLNGTCLWGCARRALYSSLGDLEALRQFSNVTYRPGFIVEAVKSGATGPEVLGVDSAGSTRIAAKYLVLAAGTLATTRLVLEALDYKEPVSFQSNPTAAFLIWQPEALGRPAEVTSSLGLLAYSLDLGEQINGYGSLFSPLGLPYSEFVRAAPMRRAIAVDIFSHLLSSCSVGNLFLPGHLCQGNVRLREDRHLLVKGAYSPSVEALTRQAKKKLSAAFLQLGAILIPSSFILGAPGADIHYACSLPMRTRPKRTQTNAYGEVAGLDGIFVVDGACLPVLPAKPHTLTIMANADRIGRCLAKRYHNI